MTLIIDSGFLWNESVWNPSMISTALWLDAADSTTLFTTDTGSTLATNGSAVGRWNDKSGNGRNVVQSTSGSRPTYNATGQNNLGSLAFNSTSTTFLQRTEPNLSNTFTCVVAASNSVITGAPCMFGQGTTNLNPRFQMDRNGTDARMIRINDGNNLANAVQAGVHSVSAFIQVATDNGSLQGVSLNGASLSTISAISANYSTAILTVGAVYASAPSPSALWNGSIFEVVYAPVMLSTLDRQKLEGYLAHKWGLTTNLPSDHPYKIAAPVP